MEVKVIKEHYSEYPNPISFEKGDNLILGEFDNEFGGCWVFTKTICGNEGWAPVQYIDFKLGELKGIAKCSYNAFELSTCLDEYLTVIKELNEWYLVCNNRDDIGWVPIKTVKVVNENEK